VGANPTGLHQFDRESRTNMQLVTVGNIQDGLTFYGPFDNFDDANDFCQEHLSTEDWMICILILPQ